MQQRLKLPPCAGPSSCVCPDLAELIPGPAEGMLLGIRATVGVAGAGNTLAIAAGRDEVAAGAMPGDKPVRGALADDALDNDASICDLTPGGVATDNAGLWRK